MKTVYATKTCPDAHEAAKIEFGSDVLIGYPYSKDTAPYLAEEYEVIGFTAAHRSGPKMPVIRRKA